MISDRLVDQAYSDLKDICGGVRQDYYGLLYLEHEYNVPREKALNQIAFGGNDYGVDGFHFDADRHNLYIFQFKYSDSPTLFKDSFKRLIDVGMDRIFHSPNVDEGKNQILLQLRSCLQENKAIVDQVLFQFIFKGEAAEAERSTVLERLREDLENKKYHMDQFFSGRQVGMVVEFRSSSGRVGSLTTPHRTHTFNVSLSSLQSLDGPNGQQIHLGFIRLIDLHRIHKAIGSRFFESNIRHGLGEDKWVNRALSSALKRIIIDRVDDPVLFAFNHNGISLYAERLETQDGSSQLTAPRLLNGAQTVTTLTTFLEKFKDHPQVIEGKEILESIRLLCKIITDADQEFVTRVTINNNCQNPVEPWNLHANDLIQRELQDWFRTELGIYYERQEQAFQQLTEEDLDEFGIEEESKPIKLLKLTETFLVTDGALSKVANKRLIFEDDRLYDMVFSESRMKSDARHVLLCYKVQLRLRKLIRDITEKGSQKYWYISRARHLIWALICQGLLNDDNLEELAEDYGTDLRFPANFMERLSYIATTKVRFLLRELVMDTYYSDKVEEENFNFFRTDRAFNKCMEIAYRKWRWTHIKLK